MKYLAYGISEDFQVGFIFETIKLMLYIVLIFSFVHNYNVNITFTNWTGVCQLTWIERKLAATLFATPPSASISDALLAFKTAEELAPNTNKSNLFYLAKVFT